MVFRTIAENIKSFFQKEEELERDPNRVKDAAIEVFEKPDRRIVAHGLRGAPLPSTSELARAAQSAQPAPEAAPRRLPFSSEQLRERLAPAGSVSSASTSSSSPSPRPARPSITDDEIATQIVEFEQAIRTIPGEDGSGIPLSGAAMPAAAAARMRSARVGFFDGFGAFLRDKGYEVDDSLLEESLVRMKLHHERRLEHERHRERGATIEEQLGHKLAELQELEHEWAGKQEEIIVARERSVEIEETIARRTGELKALVSTMRSHALDAPKPAVDLLAPSTPSAPAQSSPVAQTVAAAASPSSPSPLTGSPLPEAPPVAESPPPMSAPPLPPSAVLAAASPLSEPVSSHSSPSSSPLSPSSSSPAASPSSPSSLPSPPSSSAPSSPALSSSSGRLPPEKRFFLSDGRILSSLADLKDALLAMDDSVFHHHVGPGRNDFSNWIRDVFSDSALAERASHATNRYSLLSILVG